MKCPNCKDKDLIISERAKIEIDYCPECRGVWLDRGELDKIIERSESDQDAGLSSRAPMQQPQYGYGKHSGYGHGRKSMLRELFD